MGGHTGRLRAGVPESHPQQFRSLTRGVSSSFPLTRHSDLPGSQSIFGVSQDPSLCAHASVSQEGFYCKGVQVTYIS